MKILSKLLLLGFILVLVVSLILSNMHSPVAVKFGVTFSQKYAKYLKLDWQQTYLRILDELQVKNLRIPGYWDILEPQNNQYDFTGMDFMLDEAGKKQAKVVLVLGVRQPRWPECHIPAWAKKLSVSERRQNILKFIQKVVEKYKDNSTIWAWQVENEPLLGSFGEGCDSPDKNFLEQEVKLVRSLSNKTVIMTDSGELGFWTTSMQLSDVFGTTIYRQVYDKYIGYMTYPLPPSLYTIKSDLVRSIFAPQNKKTIVIELQAEAWLGDGVFSPPEEQAKRFTIENFKDYTNFVKQTGFDEAYLWGAEWWYFMAVNGHPEYLNYAKTLF